MYPWTYLFPVLAAVFVAVFFLMGLHGKDLEADSGKSRLKKAPVPPSVKKRTKPSIPGIAALTVVYAVVAFANLGDRSAPETFCQMPTGGRVEVTFAQPENVGRIFYFAGLNTGESDIYILKNGAEVYAGKLPQEYRDVFKWRDAELEETGFVADGVVFYPHGDRREDMEIGEMAFFTEDGLRIDPSDIAVTEGDPALTDEPMAVPERSTWHNSTYFDEIYHARTALEHLRTIWPYEISHPPLGKLILSLGLVLFGVNPFGWRFMGTLFGVLMVPVMWAFLRRLFEDERIALCGAAIFAFDFMHFTQTRIATIDTYGVFFILLMYLFFWKWFSGGKGRDLALSGVFFGLGAASKWTCLYAGAGLGVLWLLYWFFRLREEREAAWKPFLRNIGFCLIWFVAVPAVLYYLSYAPYGLAEGMKSPGMFFSKGYLKLVLDNQQSMFSYHAGLVAEHPYSSTWWQWLFDVRPILYYLDYGDNTVTSIAAFVSPILCWAGLISVLILVVFAVRRHDRRALFIVVGYLAQLVPWMVVTRLTFAYHYFAAVVFLVLALCAVFDEMRKCGHIRWMYAFTGASAALFALFYPALSGLEVGRYFSWKVLKWFPTWPL